MRPLAVLNAIVFGSAAAITFGLVGVLVIFLVLQGEYPQMRAEFPVLVRSSALFALLAAVPGASLPVAAASEKFGGMDQNLAEIHGPGNMIQRDTVGENLGFSMDRRVSVAPMMDYTDARTFG